MTETITTEPLLSDNNIFETVFEHSPTAFILLREVRDNKEKIVNFQYTRLNQSAQKLLAQKKSGDLLLEKKAALQEVALFENLVFSIKTGKASEMVFFSPWHDKYFWLRISTHRINDELLMFGLEDITLQKLAEQELREHVHFAENISAALPAVIMIIDLEKKEMVYMNREYHENLGYTLEEMRTFDQQLALIHPDDLSLTFSYRKAILSAKDNETVENELRIKAKNGDWLWFRSVGKVFKRNSKGIPVQYISVMRNITENKKAESEWLDNAHLLQSIFETSLTGIAVMKSVRNQYNRVVDFEFTLLNASGHRILGTNIVGRKLSDVFTGENAAAFIGLNRQVVEKGKTLDIETYHENNGLKGWYHVTAAKLGDGVVMNFDNITARKQNERKIKKTNDWLNSVLDNTSNSIMAFKAVRSQNGTLIDFRYLFVNKKAEESVNRKNLKGKLFTREFPGALTSGLFEKYRQVVETGHAWKDEIHLDFDGMDMWVLVNATPMDDGCLVTYLDMTEKKKSEQEIKEARAFLQSVGDVSSDIMVQRDNYLAQISGGGKMGELIRTKDWSLTSLGALEFWPQSLKTAVNLMLNSQQPIWIGWGPEVTFLYNDAYISVLSRAKHPLALGLPAAEVWNEIWDFCGPLVNKVFVQGEASFVDNVQLFMFRGSYYEETYYSFSYSPIRDESGKVVGIFCPYTEITEKALATRRLRTLSELAANALVEKTTHAACFTAVKTLTKNTADLPFALLYLTDNDGKHAILQEYMGIPDGSPLTLDKKIDLTDTAALVHFPLPEVFRTGRSKTVFVDESFMVPKGLAGQNVTRALVLPVKAPGQENPIGILVAGVNPARKIDSDYFTFYEIVAGQVAAAIDNAKEAEEEKKRIDLMAEVDRAKINFFSNVSHEFRTPLTLMLGPLEEVMQHPGEASEVARKNLVMVYNNTLRLQKLVNSLLDFSRIESGRISAAFQLTDVAEITCDLASNFRSAIEKARMQFVVNCETFDDEVYLDRDMWEKIVLNLISNAFKYTYKGKIEVSLKKVGKHFDLSVSDTGIGITPSEQKKIFERFYTVRNVKGRTQEGSGIGLSLVKELVKIHRGYIRLKSEPGKGSVFTVSIPLGKHHLPQDKIVRNFSLQFKDNSEAYISEALKWLPDESTCPEATGSETQTGKPIVLLCDDNNDMRDYVRRLIEKDYEVHTATNGREALEQIADQQPDLVLTDIMMPEMNGNELLKEIRKNPATTALPVIMISARAGEEARLEGLEAGADAYLVKPFTAKELLAGIYSVIKTTEKRKISENREQHFRELLDEMPSSVLILRGPEYNIEFVNNTFLKTVDKLASQVRNKSFFSVFPLWTKYLEPVLANVMAKGQIYRHPQLKLELKSDKTVEHFFSFSCKRTGGTRNERTGLVLVLQDVSGQVKAEKLSDTKTQENSEQFHEQVTVMEKRLKKLEKTNEELKQFNSIISNDLKEPVRKIQTYSRLMGTEITDNNTKKYLYQIEIATERIKDLVGGILDRALLSENAPLYIQVDTGKMIEKVKEDLDLLIAEKNASLVYEKMPVIQGRPFQLHQLFYNLVENSLKYAGKDPVIRITAIKITAAAAKKYGLHEKQKYVCLKFTDTGTGFDPKLAQQIFEQEDPQSTGNSIGLRICKKIVDNHRGKIQATSGVNKGAVITVILPE